MNGNELLRKLKAVAKQRGLEYRFVIERGKGSHGMVYLGSRFTVVKDRTKEIGPSLLKSMLSDLGLTKGNRSVPFPPFMGERLGGHMRQLKRCLSYVTHSQGLALRDQAVDLIRQGL